MKSKTSIEPFIEKQQLGFVTFESSTSQFLQRYVNDVT